jgi:hypothetical protein
MKPDGSQKKTWLECSYCGKWFLSSEEFCPACKNPPDGGFLTDPREEWPLGLKLLMVAIPFIAVLIAIASYFLRTAKSDLLK